MPSLCMNDCKICKNNKSHFPVSIHSGFIISLVMKEIGICEPLTLSEDIPEDITVNENKRTDSIKWR